MKMARSRFVGWASLVAVGCFMSAGVTLLRAQDTEHSVVPLRLIDWTKSTSQESGFFEEMKARLEKIADMLVRLTSPDVPVEDRRLWIISIEDRRKFLLSAEVGVRRPRWGVGEYIVYEVETDTNGDGTIDAHDDILMRVVSAGGGKSVTLGPGRFPVWSPDGKHIAYVNHNGISYYDFRGQAVAMSDRTELEGQIIITDRRSVARAEKFWAYDIQSQEFDKLPEDLGNRYLWLGSISPSGSYLAFHDTMHSDVFIRNLNDTFEVNLTSDPYVDMDPSWSPDGDRIVYVSNKLAQENQ